MNPLARLAPAVLLAAALLDPVTSLDRTLNDALQARRGGGAVEKVMHAATSVGSPRNMFAVMVVVAAFGGPVGPTVVREAVLVLGPVNLVVEGLKRAVDRPRPDGSHDRNNASFPSSHAANAVALAYLVTRRWPRSGWVAFPLAALVAFSRMWLGRHYLSDVLVGVVIGFAGAYAGTGWARGALRRWVDTGRYRDG